MPACQLNDIARLAEPGDNVAIVSRRIEAGTDVASEDGASFSVAHTLLEGHRFAIRPIPAGESVLSWGLPFGLATRDIAPGDYICNADILDALRVRNVDFALPDQPNFEDRVVPYELDASAFTPGEQVPVSDSPPAFEGYDRGPARGVGTRNYIVLLGITSQTAGFVRRLESMLKDRADRYPNVDGVVAVAHTEGGAGVDPNNRELVLRTLAGFMVHSNVGAVLAVDRGTEIVSDRMLENYMRINRYPLNDVPHRFETLKGGFEEDLAHCAEIVAGWFETVNRVSRKPASAAHLNIVLQCGGSDSFSGISGNPLAARVAREIIRFGGKANLAETDELIGGEPYVLDNVRDIETARTFLHMIERFQERTAWHGQSVDANPSGGNKLRGIYNLVLKSIGAARKRHPDVRLDYAIDYAVPMKEPGYYFMDSPGNDLEAIAGQVASGGNLIFFITGNGSITNFPFVPTIKFVTTTKRYEMLSGEMDVNAGAYLDGMTMDQLCGESLDLLVEIVSGRRSKGELAGHSQISIWRNWQQQDHSQLQTILERPQPEGNPLSIRTQPGELERTDLPQPAGARVGLILPTSLCSSQIAGMAAQRLKRVASEPKADGPCEAGMPPLFTALPHTEGCGVAFASTQAIYARTMIGYATHPLVGACLFLEHGCEKAHNDYIHSLLRDGGLAEEDFGWASVQLDGGIASVLDKIDGYFAEQDSKLRRQNEHDRKLSLALLSDGAVPAAVAETLARIARWVAAAGGTVVTPVSGGLIEAPAFRAALGIDAADLAPSLAYGQAAEAVGFHLMEMPTSHWSETLTGLGASGAQLIIAYSDRLRAGHPLVPILQLAGEEARTAPDLRLCGDPGAWPQQILDLAAQTLAGSYQPQCTVHKHIDFQLTRGLLGIST